MPLSLGQQMKVVLINVLLLLSLSETVFSQDTPSATPTCSLIDKSRDSTFVTYERMGDVTQGESISREMVLVRLHNNTSCALIIRTTNAQKFVIDRSAAFTPKNIRHDFADGEFVPELAFLIQDGRHSKPPYGFGDDFFFEFNLLGSRSILFGIPVVYLKRGFDIVVPFKFAWENPSGAPKVRLTGDVRHEVYFYGDSMPANVRQQIGRP